MFVRSTQAPPPESCELSILLVVGLEPQASYDRFGAANAPPFECFLIKLDVAVHIIENQQLPSVIARAFRGASAIRYLILSATKKPPRIPLKRFEMET